MKYSLVMAISVSVLLIGIASWSRFIDRDTASAGLVAVNSYSNQNYEDFLNDFLPSENINASSTTGVETLSNTELISRGLITDYINLSLSGQVDNDDITNLVNQYVNNIPKLTQTERVTQANITIVSNTMENRGAYSGEIERIYTKHSKAFDDIAIARAESYNTAFKDEAVSMGNIYKNLASDLTKIRVPNIISAYHLQLINTYLLNVDALKAITSAETDPIVALAGVTAFKESVTAEKDIILKIEQILSSSGI